MEVLRSACPLDCPDACGLEVTVDGGRVVAVDGDHRNPITDGFVCGKVRKIAEHLYSPHRVLAPRVRTGPKGSGQWREVGWDEALALVAGKLADIRARAGGEAILPYHYGGSNGWLTEGGLASRLFHRLGACNLEPTYCAAATTAATRGLYGKLPGVSLEDFVHARLIVLWGVNPSATGIHLVPIIERARERGAQLVVLDPRRTPLARRADLHLPLKPGTDLPVALAVIGALFERGLADEEFLARHATGGGELRAHAARWSLATAAAESGIAASELERFVELYAHASPAVIRCGWGVERNRNGGSAVAAILALPAVAGKLGVRGGGYTLSNGDARWGVASDAAVGEPAPNTRSVNMSELARVVREARDPRIECVFVYNCNPVATCPDQRGVIEQLSRDDVFVVVHDKVMTDTCAVADVVLPATAFLERRELFRSYGVARMFDSPPVVPAPGQAWSNTQLFGALLERLGLVREGDAMTDAALVDRIMSSHERGAELSGQLAERTVAMPPPELPFVDVFPDTADGKIHLAAAPYRYRPDPATQAFPLALISPALATQTCSTFGELRDAPGVLELAPQDAAARGIRDGDEVRIWNELGELHCAARVSRDLRPGVCSFPKGLWRKHTANGLTSNALIPAAFADLGGQAAWNDARVQVAKR